MLWSGSCLFVFLLISFSLAYISPNLNTILNISAVFSHILFSPSNRKILPRTTWLPQPDNRTASSFFWNRYGTFFPRFPILVSSPHLLFSFFLLCDWLGHRSFASLFPNTTFLWILLPFHLFISGSCFFLFLLPFWRPLSWTIQHSNSGFSHLGNVLAFHHGF